MVIGAVHSSTLLELDEDEDNELLLSSQALAVLQLIEETGGSTLTEILLGVFHWSGTHPHR